MAGHSKWAKIKRQKGAEDAKRGQLFTKLGNAIAIAARNGSDPAMNPTLALAIEKAKASNMPNANIERSIKRGSGELSGEQITELLFEAYGPGGIGIIVETATDNRNRTTTDVRTALSKNGGSLAEPGSVAYQFSRKGVVRVGVGADADETMLLALDCGAEDVIESDNELIIYTQLKKSHEVEEKLKQNGVKVIDSELQYVPNDLVEVTDKDQAKKALKLLNAIEDVEDVISTYTNFGFEGDLDG